MSLQFLLISKINNNNYNKINNVLMPCFVQSLVYMTHAVLVNNIVIWQMIAKFSLTAASL